MVLPCRHAKELQQQADTATAASQAAAAEAASEAAALTARYGATLLQLQQLMEQQGGQAGAQLADMHMRAEQQQQRLAGLTQQLCALLQLPIQQQQQQQPGAFSLHQTYAASAGSGPGSAAGSPVRSSIQQQQWPGSPGATSGTWSPSRLGTQQQQQAAAQQQQQAAALPADVQELCSALSAAVGGQSQPEDVAGALQALVSGLTQVLLGVVGQAAALEAALAEAHAENEQLLADGTALAGTVQLLQVPWVLAVCYMHGGSPLPEHGSVRQRLCVDVLVWRRVYVWCAGDFQSCASNLQSLVATLAMCVNLSEDMQQGLNARDQAVFDDQLAALPQVGTERQAMGAHLRMRESVSYIPTKQAA